MELLTTFCTAEAIFLTIYSSLLPLICFRHVYRITNIHFRLQTGPVRQQDIDIRKPPAVSFGI